MVVLAMTKTDNFFQEFHPYLFGSSAHFTQNDVAFVNRQQLQLTLDHLANAKYTARQSYAWASVTWDWKHRIRNLDLSIEPIVSRQKNG
jgi:hypothetical protein